MQTAADGRLGLRAVDDFKPDLVIVDVMMPRLDGFELTRAIAGEPRRGIIILSAKDEITDRIHGLELGADDYLVKPFDFARWPGSRRAAPPQPRPQPDGAGRRSHH